MGEQGAKRQNDGWKGIGVTIAILAIATGIGAMFRYLRFTEANILIVYVLGVMITAVITASRMWRDYTMLHWLTILLENREFDASTPLAAEAKEYLLQNFHLDYEKADIIIGYRADDSYFSFAADFINGAISYRQLSNAMRLGKLGQQFVLKSTRAFERLEFTGYEIASVQEWYKRKASRDHMARRQYFDLERNRRQRGDLYITTILDEEMKPDDPRLR